MAKKLNSLHIKAAELIARGTGEADVASSCGKSRSWVQALKRREEFQQAVEDAKDRAIEVIAREAEKAIASDLDQFRERFNAAANLLYSSATKYLEKLHEKIENLSQDDISPSRLSQSLKNGADTLVLSLEIQKAALGIDELLTEVDDIKKISQINFKSADGNKPVITRFETN